MLQLKSLHHHKVCCGNIKSIRYIVMQSLSLWHSGIPQLFTGQHNITEWPLYYSILSGWDDALPLNQGCYCLHPSDGQCVILHEVIVDSPMILYNRSHVSLNSHKSNCYEVNLISIKQYNKHSNETIMTAFLPFLNRGLFHLITYFLIKQSLFLLRRNATNLQVKID